MRETEILGWALLHSLWQGALIALLLRAALAALGGASAAARYRAAWGALLLTVAIPLATGIYLARGTAPPPILPELLPRWDGGHRLGPWLSGLVNWAPLLWAAGVMLQTLRLALGFRHSRRLRDVAVVNAGAGAQAIADGLAARLGIRRFPPLLESALVDVPSVVGWLRPAILAPASALSGLTSAQLEMIMAHELAHIRRRDPLANLAQTAIEAALFYHPAAWWISAKIRQEREHCCDEAAVALCGDPVGYARSLTRLERLRQDWPNLAVASTDGSLLERVRRLVIRKPARAGAPRFAGAVVLFLALGVLLVVPGESVRATHALKAPAARPVFRVRFHPARPARVVPVEHPGSLDLPAPPIPAPEPPRTAPAPLEAIVPEAHAGPRLPPPRVAATRYDTLWPVR